MADALIAHFDGVADEASRQLAISHLTTCPACTRMWAEWQELKAFEQSALQPLSGMNSGEVPLAPVVVPRHLQQSILHRTSRAEVPFWHRLWPRIAVGIAVPAVAAACWALLVLAPGQVSPTTEQPPQVIATLPASPMPDQNTPKSTVITTPVAPKEVTKVDVSAKEKSDTSAPAPQVHLIAAANTSAQSKSTFTRSSRRKHRNRGKRKWRRSRGLSPANKPQISLVSAERPQSRASKAVITKASSNPRIATSSPRATAPNRATTPESANTWIASAPENEEYADPVLEYINAHDVRPVEIRQAVENYRSALLTARLDDSEL